MRRASMFASALVLGVVTTHALSQSANSSAGGSPDVASVAAEVIATGIPGAGAITQIGTFHQGGPFVE